MMDIVSHINELLFRHECVIVPSFGAFLIHHQSAYVDRETKAFMPPSKSLSFNRQLQTNDGLLVSHLSQTYGLSYRESLEDLQVQVQIWIEQLENKIPLHFMGLGVLQSNEEGKWEFTASPDNIFQANSFGLTPINSQKIYREELELPEQKVIPIHSAIAKEKSANKYLRYIAGAAVIVLLLGAGGYSWYQKDTQQYNLVQQQLAEKELEKRIHTASFTIANPLPTIALSLTKEKTPYHIVAGAFRELENAEKRVGELQEEGFKARILRKNSYGLHEVVYNSYTSKREAINEMHRIMRTHNDKAWLLVDED